MRRIIRLIAGLLLLASVALPGIDAAGQLANRCRRLKQRFSPSAQHILSKMQLGFDAALAANPAIRSSELSMLARNKVREGFPKASVAQVDGIAVILLTDWIVRQKAEARQLERAKAVAASSRGRTSRPGGLSEPLNTDSELAMIRMNDLIGQAQMAVEQMAKLLEHQNETMEQLLDNF